MQNESQNVEYKSTANKTFNSLFLKEPCQLKSVVRRKRDNQIQRITQDPRLKIQILMPMRRFLYISALFLLLVSCSKSKEERRAFVAFQHIIDADSLYAIGKTEEADLLLDEVLKQNNEIEYPTAARRLRWAILSDIDNEEGSLYYDYIFLYMAQMEAIAMKNKHEDDPLKKIETMKRLFTLAPDFENVIESYLNSYDAAYSAYSSFINKYNECFNKVRLTYYFGGYRRDLPFYLNRVKWLIMNTLLIESDKELGYEKTFAFFDSILEDQGTTFQEYTKALVKSYMSFSELPKYEYETEMGYEEFKTIVADTDRWYAAWLYETKEGTSLFGREIIPQSGGILVECGDRFVWNPTKTTMPLLWDDDTVKLVTIDGLETKEIILDKENQNLWVISSVNIHKPLLCALLYRHGLGTFVPRVLESKQYYKNDVFVREGEENGFKKFVEYNKSFKEIGWHLYNKEGLPVCDSTGTHCLRVVESEDSTITYYLGTDMLLREKRPAFEVDLHNERYESHYYDSQNNLYKKDVDDTITYYKNNDSLLITIKYNFETSFTVVTTEFLNCLDSTNRPTKEVKVYNDWYDEETDQQFGDVVLIQHPLMNCSNLSDSIMWPFEQRWYDEQHRVTGIAYFDRDKVFQGGLTYQYEDNGKTNVYYYDSNNLLYRSETD